VTTIVDNQSLSVGIKADKGYRTTLMDVFNGSRFTATQCNNSYKTTLMDVSSGSVVASDVFIATSFWHRLRGLQFKREVSPGHAFILPGCNSIHTCFMHFDLDVIFIDRDWKVLRVFKGVRPFRFIKPQRGAYAAIEMNAGEAKVCPGHKLQLQ
jgi:uncharacterized membrane protein (UPF0127 family)